MKWGTEHLTGWLIAALGVGPLLLNPGCSTSPGYRDQFYHSLDASGDRATRAGYDPTEIRLEEWLSAYHFAPPSPAASGPVSPELRAVIGATSEDRQAGRGWLLLTVSTGAPKTLPPRRWVFVLDAGDGMKGERWTLALQAARTLAGQMSALDRLRILESGSDEANRSNGKVGITERNTDWLPRQLALQEIDRRARQPSGGFGDDAPVTSPLVRVSIAMAKPANGELTAPAVFLFTDGTGSEQLKWELGGGSYLDQPDVENLQYPYVRKSSIPVNVIGVAGGNETALRTLARAAGGSYVYLASMADIGRTLAGKAPELFDTVYNDAKIRLVDEKGNAPFPPAFDYPRPNIGSYYGDYRGGCGCSRSSSPWKGLPEQAQRGWIGRLGPGEVWVRVLPVPLQHAQEMMALHPEFSGKDVYGYPAESKGTLQPAVLDLDRPCSAEARTLLKALAVRAQVEQLKKVTDEGLAKTGLWREGLETMCAQLRRTQAILHDPELAADLAQWEAIRSLSPQQLEQLRQEQKLHLSFGQQAKRAGTTAAITGAVAGVVTIGGVVIVTGALPYLFLHAVLS